MAFLVSVSFSLVPPISSGQDLQLKKTAMVKFSKQVSTRIETNLLPICRSNRDRLLSYLRRDLLSVHQTDGSLTLLVDHFSQFSSCISVSPCNQKPIVGCWMGPDIDDGWGFVEAFVDQIS